MPSKVDDLVLRIEALLFASGKPLSVRELTDSLHAPDHRPVQRALRTLTRAYDQRQTALEVRRVGDRFALQLREPFVPGAQPLTPVDMAPRTLKTLTLIAYHQPILQSRLVRMMGETAYDEVEKLRVASLVHAEPKGATIELTTTHRFAEQFGIASTRPEEIRRFLERKLGVEAPSGPAPETPPSAEGPSTASNVEPAAATPAETSPAIG